MRMIVNTVVSEVGKKSGKPFRIVGGMLTTPKGTQYAEFFFDVEQPAPKINVAYDLGVECFPDREKKLQFRVVQLREVSAKAA